MSSGSEGDDGSVGAAADAPGGAERRRAADAGNVGGGSVVYPAMRTSAASSPPPGARRLPSGRSPAYAPAATSPPGSRAAPPSPFAPGARVAGSAVRSVRADDTGGAAADREHRVGEDGFSAFYRAAWPGVARALAVVLGDRDLAIEATDEAMARAYPRWQKLSSYDNPGAWVYRVGLNWARSYRRRLARRPPPGGRTDVDLPPVGDPAVRAALLALPLAQRSVVVCRLLLDWSVDDTATALGIRAATVRTRQHRALRSLNQALGHTR